MNLLVDTNCILYLFGGDQSIASFLNGNVVHVSFVTELELLGYPGLNDSEETTVREFLSGCFIVDINREIKQLTIEFRKRTALKLPDAIVAATAQYLDIALLTADTDFKNISGLEVLLYVE